MDLLTMAVLASGILLFLAYGVIWGNGQIRGNMTPDRHDWLATAAPFLSHSETFAKCIILTLDFFVYLYFCVVYLTEVVPEMPLFLSSWEPHVIASYFVIPLPILLYGALWILDPGVITKSNVSTYLSKYPCDNVIYHQRTCPTDGIPVVPRSRYCRFTNCRIAYVVAF